MMINIPEVAAPTPLSAATQIYLCKGIPWDREYKHVRLFGGKDAALSYIKSKAEYTTTTATAVRDNSVRLEIPYTKVLEGINYIAYNNTNLYNFWIFGFITDVKYTNQNVTEINFEIDFFQTYFYKCKLQQCFVERHHWERSDDIIGANCLPEPVSKGFYQFYNSQEFKICGEGNTPDTNILLFTVADASDLESEPPGMLGNVFSGIRYKFGSSSQMQHILNTLIHQGKGSEIIAIYMCPEFCYRNNSEILTVQSDTAFGSITANIKNNKMFTYPFSYVDCLFYGSGEMELYYEKAGRSGISVRIQGCCAPFPQVTAYADTYDGNQTHNLKYSLDFTNFPTCAVANDTYAQYINTQGISTALSVLGSGIQFGQGVLSKNPASILGGVLGAAQSIGNTITAMERPDTAIGTMGQGGTLYAMNQIKVKLLQLGYDEQSAIAADNFMSIYGYNTQQVLTPNLNSRTLWNYVKTLDCNISGDIGYIALEKLNSIFNNGVFLWHTNDIGNFNIEGNG